MSPYLERALALARNGARLPARVHPQGRDVHHHHHSGATALVALMSAIAGGSAAWLWITQAGDLVPLNRTMQVALEVIDDTVKRDGIARMSAADLAGRLVLSPQALQVARTIDALPSARPAGSWWWPWVGGGAPVLGREQAVGAWLRAFGTASPEGAASRLAWLQAFVNVGDRERRLMEGIQALPPPVRTALITRLDAFRDPEVWNDAAWWHALDRGHRGALRDIAKSYTSSDRAPYPCLAYWGPDASRWHQQGKPIGTCLVAVPW